MQVVKVPGIISEGVYSAPSMFRDVFLARVPEPGFSLRVGEPPLRQRPMNKS